jgi:tight adherence protein B
MMVDLLAIYGLTFSSAGLLAFTTFPEVEHQVRRYMTVQVADTDEKLENMFIALPARRLVLAYAAAPLLSGFVGYGVFGGLIGLLGGVAVGFLVPRGVLRLIAWNRRRQFQRQLVEALLVLSSSLRAGLSLLQSMEVLAEEAQPPMSQEIGLVTKETRMGLALDESLKRFKKRLPMDELNLVVTAMLVSRETGGDVTAVFAKLIETIRERIKIKERIKTLTVIPRMQGWLMAVIPFLFGMFALKINPQYFDMLLHDQVGNVVGLAAVGLWVVSLALIFWFSRPPR